MGSWCAHERDAGSVLRPRRMTAVRGRWTSAAAHTPWRCPVTLRCTFSAEQGSRSGQGQNSRAHCTSEPSRMRSRARGSAWLSASPVLPRQGRARPCRAGCYRRACAQARAQYGIPTQPTGTPGGPVHSCSCRRGPSTLTWAVLGKVNSRHAPSAPACSWSLRPAIEAEQQRRTDRECADHRGAAHPMAQAVAASVALRIVCLVTGVHPRDFTGRIQHRTSHAGELGSGRQRWVGARLVVDATGTLTRACATSCH